MLGIDMKVWLHLDGFLLENTGFVQLEFGAFFFFYSRKLGLKRKLLEVQVETISLWNTIICSDAPPQYLDKVPVLNTDFL